MKAVHHHSPEGLMGSLLRAIASMGAGALLALAAMPAQAQTSTTTTLSASPSAPTLNQPVTLTATISGNAPTGSVTFKDGSTTLGTATVAAGDPSWSSVSLLLHADGTNGSTTITDAASNAVVTANGTAKIQTAVAKSGSGALQFGSGGSSGWATTPGSSALNLATGDFTVELWLYATASGAQIVLNKANGTGYYPWQVLINGSGQIEARGFSSGNSLVYDITGPTASLNAWHHVALVRAGSTFALYVDGTSAGSASYSGTLYGSTETLSIGAYSTGIYSLSGYVDEVRITKGVARYGAAFTPANTAFASGPIAALLPIGTLAAGSHSFTAAYSGDAANAASTSAALNITVSGTVTTTNLSAAPGAPTLGQNVTLTAAVTGNAPTGSVTFFDGGGTLGTSSLASGSATLNTSALAVGNHTLSASYSGDGYNFSSTSATTTLNVGPAPTTTGLTISPNPAIPGQAIALRATVTGASPSGTVSFSDGTAQLGSASLSAGSATLSLTTLGAGSHLLSASYGGDTNNQPSSSSVSGAIVDAGNTTSPGAMTWQYSYDAQGNGIGVVDPNGNATAMAYDGLQRMSVLAQPAPAPGAAIPAIALGYNGQDRLTRVTDPRSLQTQYTVDGLGNRTAEASPDKGSTTDVYDAAGRLTSRTDARGKTTSYAYDNIDRLTSISYASGTASTFEYDGGTTPVPGAIGRLMKMTDESGSTSYGYDGFSRLVTKQQVTNGKAFSVGYGWGTSGTATGKLVSVTYPSGMQVVYGFDAAGRINSVAVHPVNPSGSGTSTTTLNVITNLAYNGENNPLGWTWGDGTAYQRSYDSFGRLSSYPLGNPATSGLLRTLGYDPAGRITGYSHTNAAGAQAAADQGFGYDNQDRLTSNNQSSTAYAYSYDANGNRVSRSIGAGVYANSVDPNSNRLTQVQEPGTSGTVTRSYQYDAAGHLTGDGVNTFAYSDRGRMASATTPSGTVSYRYNALEQRVYKSGTPVATGAAYYTFDEQGHVLGEYTASGAPLYETVYLGDTPVAVVKQSGSAPSVQTTIGFVYADHINTPRVIARSTDHAIVWRWDQAEAFGASVVNDNPGGYGSYAFNQRGMGRVFDAETGIFQNVNREYLPAGGRFIQPDPMGLAAGDVGLFNPVSNNPLSFVDPNGLMGVGGGGSAGSGRVLSPVNPAAHDYIWRVFRCMGDCRNKTMQELLCNPAPGVYPRRPTQTGDVNMVSLAGYELGPITTAVSPATMTTWNLTMPGHLLHPGWVKREVVFDGAATWVVTTGGGDGFNPLNLNSILAPIVWGGRNPLPGTSNDCLCGR